VAQLDNVIAELLAIEGANGAAIVDIDSGMALAFGGTPGFDLNVAAAGNSNVVRAKLRTINDLEIKEEIEDVLITLQHQYHLINVLKGQGNSGLFIYLVLNRVTANLALARHKLRAVAAAVTV
jgi:predicted regulator of Ras-like GTPase activity (Roadblock/LC7/MglB family)